MALIEGFEYGLVTYGRVEDKDVWHVRRVDAPQMLCGATPRFVPVLAQPADPSPVHELCANLMHAVAVHRPADVAVTGECPVCGGEARILGGVVAAHGQWRVTRAGLVQSETPCGGGVR